MVTLLRREFTVDMPLKNAWQHLARVERWPSWAKHIKQIDVQPPGELGPKSAGLIRLSNGVKSTFTMIEFNPGRNWKWVGGFLWLTVHYDHRFEQVNSQQTKLVWIIDPDARTVAVFTDPTTHTVLTATDTLDGGAVLPGFTLPLADLFNDPQLNPRV